LKQALGKNDEVLDSSGSCAIISLIINNVCYIANVGDSRAIMSGNNGKKLFPLSRDHKPSDKEERLRIVNNGGKIY